MVTSKHGPSIANIETSSVAARLPSVPKMFIPFNSLGLEMEYVIRPWSTVKKQNWPISAMLAKRSATERFMAVSRLNPPILTRLKMSRPHRALDQDRPRTAPGGLRSFSVHPQPTSELVHVGF